MTYSNTKHVASTAFLILILCVLNTNQTLFSFRKSTSTTAAPISDNVAEQTGNSAVTHKEPSSHWWQIKYQQPTESSVESSGSNHIAVAVPLIHHKLQSIIDAQLNSDVKWLPCLCPTRKADQLHQLHQSQHQSYQPQLYQPQPQQSQLYQPQPPPPPPQPQLYQQQQSQPQQQSQQQYGPPSSSYYGSSTTPAPSDNVPRFILANYPIEA